MIWTSSLKSRDIFTRNVDKSHWMAISQRRDERSWIPSQYDSPIPMATPKHRSNLIQYYYNNIYISYIYTTNKSDVCFILLYIAIRDPQIALKNHWGALPWDLGFRLQIALDGADPGREEKPMEKNTWKLSGERRSTKQENITIFVTKLTCFELVSSGTPSGMRFSWWLP